MSVGMTFKRNRPVRWNRPIHRLPRLDLMYGQIEGVGVVQPPETTGNRPNLFTICQLRNSGVPAVTVNRDQPWSRDWLRWLVRASI